MPTTKRKPVKQPAPIEQVKPSNGTAPVDDGGDIIADLFKRNVSTRESDRLLEFKAAVDSVYSKIQLNMKSVLTPQQVVAFTRGLVYAQHFHSPTMLNAVNTLLELCVSIKTKGSTGSGRQDLRDVVKAMLGGREDIEARQLGQKLMGD